MAKKNPQISHGQTIKQYGIVLPRPQPRKP